MWACCAVPKHRPRGQLPEGRSAIQMMESPLLCLESLATWLSSSSTSWVPNTIVGILWGLGLYLLLLPFFASDPSSPPPSKKHGNIRKVRNPWPRLTRMSFSLFYLYFCFLESAVEAPGMGKKRSSLLRKEYKILLLGISQARHEFWQEDLAKDPRWGPGG